MRPHWRRPTIRWPISSPTISFRPTFPGFPYPSLVAVEQISLAGRDGRSRAGEEDAARIVRQPGASRIVVYRSAPRATRTCRSSSSRGRWTISSRAACSLRRRSTPVAKSQNATCCAETFNQPLVRTGRGGAGSEAGHGRFGRTQAGDNLLVGIRAQDEGFQIVRLFFRSDGRSPPT